MNGTDVSKVEEIQQIPKGWARPHFKKRFSSSNERPLSVKAITDYTGSNRRYQNVHWLMSCFFYGRIRDAVVPFLLAFPPISYLHSSSPPFMLHA
jgi:hypothetical protein